MTEQAGNTTQLQAWLERHRAGDASAKDEIIARSCERLRLLSQKMLRRNFARVSRWEQTDDVLQAVLIRLHRSLSSIQPESIAQLCGLAAQQIRWTLLDMANHHFGPEGAAAHHDTGGHRTDDQPLKNVIDASEPDTLEEWTRFHQAVDRLPEDERETFGLVWYEGLSQVETAHLLGVTERTVRRRWTSARCLLHESLGGDLQE